MCETCETARRMLRALAITEIRVKKKGQVLGGEDNPNRDRFERELAKALGPGFEEQQRELLKMLGDPPRIEDISSNFWEKWGGEFASRVQPVVQRLYLERAAQMAGELSIGINWDLVNQNAATWARQYTYDLVRGINTTTRELLRSSIEAYYQNGLTRGALEDLLSRGFTPNRAEMIAVTEVTRASSQGEIAVSKDLAQYDIVMEPHWSTNNDELVCPICGPLNGKKAAGKDVAGQPYWIHPVTGKRYGPPPAHPRCRCWTNLRL